MKDKLRELVVTMRASSESGTQSQRQIIEYWADRFAAMLDADGDGGAVAWMTHHDEPMLFLSHEEAASYCDDDEPPIPLHAHPARSGVVSDEDVEAA